jgi:acetyl esterase
MRTGDRRRMTTRRWTTSAACAAAVAVLAIVTLAPAGAADSVRITSDVAYRTVDGEQLALDVYRPATKGKDRPAVVIIHGGGWSAGDKQWFATQGNALAQRGFVAFSVNYRLVPRHPYPAAVDDVEAAVAWVRKHAKEYGVDPERIGALGGSAGAHLTGLLATSGRGSLEKGHRIAAAVSWSGPMDLETIAVAPMVQAFVGCAADACADKYAEASPITHVDKTDAPMLLVNSTMELVPQAQMDVMKAALDGAGVASEAILLPGSAHSRAFSNRVWDQTVVFLENYLKR